MPHKAIPGVPLVVKAGEYNDAMEAGQWFKQSRQLGAASPGMVLPVNPCTVRVKNDTGGALAAGAVVELSTPPLTTLDRQHIWFSGIARAGACPPFAVLLEDIPSGSIGAAQASGVMLATVNVQDAQNTHARIEAGSTTLKGDFGGPVELLKAPTGTGSQTLPVRIGARQSIIRRAKADADIAAGGSGDVSVWIDGSDVGTVTAYNDWDAGDVAANDEIRIAYHHDLDRWEILKRGSGGTSQPNAAWGCWTMGGTGKAFQDGSGTADTAPYQLTSSGLWLFGSSRNAVRQTNELGTVFTTASSGLSYDVDAIEIAQYGYYEVTLHTTWILPPLSLSNAQSLMRAASHNHSYTDDGSPMTTGNATPDVMGLNNGGVVRITSEIYYGATSQVMGTSNLPVWYGSDDYMYASHSDTFVMNNSFSLRNIRVKVYRNDSTSYAAPEFSTATLFVRQLYPFDTSAI